MALYELTADPTVIHRTSDGAWIPTSNLNPDYLTYKAWLAEGNEPDPAPSIQSAAVPFGLDDLIAVLLAKKIITPDDIKK